MRLCWWYLAVIAASQTFVLASMLLITPAIVDSRTTFVDCDRQMPAAIFASGRITDATCRELDVAFEFPPSTGRMPGAAPLTMRTFEEHTFYYQSMFQGDVEHTLLQLVCCVWVSAFVYFDDFKSVAHLLEFRDFNRWFLPLKGESPVHKQWVLILPLVQMVLSTALVCVSCCITCALDEASDVVLNCLAFTFIGQVDDLFNKPLLRYYTTERLEGLSEEYTDEIYYLVGEYAEANAWNCDGADTPPEKWFDSSWYVKQEDKVAGLLHDFRFRHCPEDYERPSERVIALLQRVFFAAPVVAVATCWALFTRTAVEHSLA